MLRFDPERSAPLRPHFTTVVVTVGTFVAALANPWGLETKIWTASSSCSRAMRSVFLRPPEVGRCLPTRLVRALGPAVGLSVKRRIVAGT
jgi:hypothetical protein